MNHNLIGHSLIHQGFLQEYYRMKMMATATHGMKGTELLNDMMKTRTCTLRTIKSLS